MFPQMRKVRSASARVRATKRSIRLVAVIAVIAVATAAALSAPSSAKLIDRLIGASAAPAGVAAAAEKPSVSTDKGVYEPGETVTFHGSNWTPGETVTIVLSEGASSEERATVSAKADEHGSFVATMTMPEGAEEEEEARERGEKGKHEVIYRAIATGSTSRASVRTHFKAREREEEEGEDDADLPRFMVGKIGKEDYLTRRAEHTNRLRGIERGKPFDAGARGRAIRDLDRKQGKKDKKSDALKGASVAAAATDESGAKVGATLAGTNFAMAGAPGWTSVGPAPIPNGQTFGITHAVSGRVTAIAVHPTNPDIAYVAAAQGGVYRTLDGGATWTAIFDNAQTLSVGALAIAPSQPSTLYVGTGEGNFSCDSYFGVGVYRIDNADGAAPALTGPFTQDTANNDVLTGRSISKVLVHPTNPGVIFIGVTNGVGGLGCDAGTATASRGLYRSTNATSANATFQKLTTNTVSGGNRSVTDMEFEPGNPNTMLATVVGFSTANDGGVYRSTNAQAANPTFTQTLSTGSLTATARTELALNKIGGVVTVYAAISDANGTVKRSLDGGVTWSAALANATGFCGTQCTYDMPIAVDPTNANVLYIGGNADGTLTAILKKSVNATAATPTFAKIQNGLHADSHAIEIDPSNNNTVWFGNDGGVWKSANGGGSWTSLNNTGFNATQFQSLALHPIDPNYAIGGTQDNGTERQRPDGTWTRTDFGDGGYALIDQSAANTTTVRQYHTYFNQASPGTPANALIAFATTTSSTAFENWSLLGCNGGTSNNGISCTDTAVLFYAPMALGPGTPNTVYFGTDKLYRSTNSGSTMTAVSQTFVSTVPVSAIGISPQNDAVRVVGLRNGKVFRTVTGANPMADVTGTLPARYISRVVVDPNNQNTAYVTHSTYFGNATAHIYKTTNLSDAAPIWTPVGGVQIPDVPVNAFAVDPADSNTLYAGTDIGVYRSLDGGTTWSAFSDGLPRVAVFDMAVQAPSRKLRIATHGRGIWEISIANSPAVIQGIVTDAGNSAPIANASVTAGSNSTTTDENGFYQFQSIPAGTYNMTVTAIGYLNGTATNVAATNGSATTQNFALTAAASSGCNVDTTVADFQAGLGANTDVLAPGDVQLALPSPVIDGSSTIQIFSNSFTATVWQAQTFTPPVSGKLNRMDFQAALTSAASTLGTVVVEIRNTVAGSPGATVLATANLTGVNSTGNLTYTVSFAAPPSVVAGTQYALVLRAGSGGPYRGTASLSNVYAGGTWQQSSNSGASWANVVNGAQTLDLVFSAFITPQVFATSGNLVSAPKDANQADGTAAGWTTLSWNATVPAGTELKFQAAGSNNPGGLFTFVGPDGTPNTFFNSGDSLAQFNGLRYLKYKAYLSTTNTSLSPTLADVTVCNSNTPLPATSLSVAPAVGIYGGTTSISATLTAGGNPVAGKPVTFKLNGANFPGNTATTDANGVATIPNISLAGLNAGVYPNYVSAKFNSDSSFAGSNGANDLTVQKATPVITWNNPADITYNTPLGAAQLNATANVPGAFVYTPAAGTILNAGSQTLSSQFTPTDTTNYNTVLTEVTLNVLKAAPVVTANGVTCTYSASPCVATGTATGVDGTDLGAVTLVYTPGGSAPVNVGDYTVVASIGETANHTAGSSAPAPVRVNQATPVINWANPSAISYGTPLGASQLNAAATLGAGGPAVSGTYVYTPAAGTVLNVGNGQTLHVDFTPDDTLNFTPASKDVSINVVKAVLTVTTVDASKVYGTPNPAFAVTYSGFLNGDTPASLGGALTFTTAATTTSNAGVYPVTPGGLTSANYALNFVAGNLTIQKAALTVTAENQVKTLGAPNPAFTVTYSGFVLGQGPSVLGGTLTFTTPATAASPVGTYTVTPGGLTSPNYAITYVDGQLFITYGVCALYDPEKAAQSGSTIPVKLQLCDVATSNFSAPGVVVHATSVIQVSTNAPAQLNDSGNANPDMNFRYTAGTPGMYIFNLSTKGYASGTYLLNFVVSGDPVPHSVKFSVR
jgi:MBG domain (YGX type)/Carboxypeptidase regulatory-like domain